MSRSFWALVLALVLGVAGFAQAQVPNVPDPSSVLPTPDLPSLPLPTPSVGPVGNTNQGGGAAGGAAPSASQIPQQVVPHAAGPSPSTGAARPAGSSSGSIRSTQSTAVRTSPPASRGGVLAAEAPSHRAVARRVARREERLRATVLKLNGCVSKLGRLDRGVLILRAHPSGPRTRPRAQVARLLALSVRGIRRVELRGLRRLRSLGRNGSCAPAAPRITSQGVVHATAIERVATSNPRTVAASAPVPASGTGKAAGTKASSVVSSGKSASGSDPAAAKDRLEVKGEFQSSGPSAPAASAGGSFGLGTPILLGLGLLVLLFVLRAARREFRSP